MTIKASMVPRYSKTATYPRTYSLIYNDLPQELIDRLTAKELALVIDFAEDQFRKGRSFERKDIVLNNEVYFDGRFFQLNEQSNP